MPTKNKSLQVSHVWSLLWKKNNSEKILSSVKVSDIYTYKEKIIEAICEIPITVIPHPHSPYPLVVPAANFT